MRMAARLACRLMLLRSTVSPGAWSPRLNAPRPTRPSTSLATKLMSPAPRFSGSSGACSARPRSRFTTFRRASNALLPSVGAMAGYPPGSKLIFALVFGAESATMASIFERTRTLCSSDKVLKSPRARAMPGMMFVLPFALIRTPSASRLASCPAATIPTLKVRLGSGSSVRKRESMRASSNAAPSP